MKTDELRLSFTTLVAALLLWLPLLARAGTGVEAWVQRYGGTTSAGDHLSGLAVDADGNVIVTGFTELGGVSREIVTVKYSGGGIGLWTNRYFIPGETYAEAKAVAVDAGSGNVYVAGHSVRPFGGYDYVTLAYSSGGTALWTNYYNGPGNGSDLSQALTVDAGNGNVYVTGDSATIAYAGTGTPLWTNRYNGYVKAIATDASNGTVYVTGSSVGTNSLEDFATVAYSSGGTPVWTNRYNGPSNGTDRAQAVVVDSGRGNVYVVGSSSADFSKYVTIAYSSFGIPLWTNQYAASNNHAVAEAIALDGQSGNVYVTGSAYEPPQQYNFLTIAYSSAGTPLWTNRLDEPGNGGYGPDDVAKAVAVDRTNGNVYVTGYSYGGSYLKHCSTVAYSRVGIPLWTNRYPNPLEGEAEPVSLAVDSNSGTVFVGALSADYLTLAYSAGGDALWTNIYSGRKGTEESVQALALDRSNGNVYVTGYSRSNVYDPEGYDWVTVAYSDGGMPLWTNRHGASGNRADRAQALAVDEIRGRVHVAGSSTFSGQFSDFTVITYSSSGTLLRTNRYNGSSDFNDSALAIAVEPVSGRFYVAGFSTSSNTFSDFTTIAYASTGAPLWTNRYDGGFSRDDGARAVAVDRNNGNVYVTGSSTLSGGGTSEYLTIAYASLGTALWTNHYHAFANDTATAIVTDPTTGNVYVTGTAGATDNINHDFVTLAYSGSGTSLWTNRYGAGSGNDFAEAIALDSNNGQIYVTGSRDFGFGSYFPTIATVAYTAAGAPLWTNIYKVSSSSVDAAHAVAVDGSGNVYVTGRSGAAVNYDYVTLVYSSAGVPLWTNRYSGMPDRGDAPTTRFCLAVTADGIAFVTGYSVTATEDSDFATVKYLFPPEITAQPQDQTNSLGATAQFMVAAAGTQPLTYRWYRNGLALSNDQHLSGATNVTLTITNLSVSDAGNYSVVVSNAAGSTASLPATLAVMAPRPRLTGIQRLIDGSVQVSGSASPNVYVRVEVSSNLLNWLPLVGFTNLNTFRFSDGEAVGWSQRFYRVVWFP